MAKKVGIQVDVNANGGIRSFKKLGNAGSDASNKIESGTKRASTGLDKMTSSLSLSKIGVVALGAAVATAGYQFVKFAINAEKEAEKVETQFTTLLGSAKLAKERFEELADFAASTPFELVGIANASKVLQTMGGDALATGEGLKLVGDAAAIANVPIDELAVSIGRAASGLKANRAVGEPIARLQELGLISGEARNAIEDLQKQAKGVEAWELLEGELKKNEGGMEALSETADGLESTLGDTFKGIGRTVAKETGIFEIYKDSLAGLIALGVEISAAFDSTAVEKVREEIESTNEELAKTDALIKLGNKIDLDIEPFIKRREELVKQKDALKEAILPADLKDKQEELKGYYKDLTEASNTYAKAIVTDEEQRAYAISSGISKFGFGVGVSQYGIIKHSLESAKAAKENIANINLEIAALVARGAVPTPKIIQQSEITETTTKKADPSQKDLSEEIIQNNIDVNESFKSGIQERIELEEARDEMLKELSDERKNSELEGFDLKLAQIQQETDAKVLQAYELIENEDMLRTAIEDINAVSDKKIMDSKKKASNEAKKIADIEFNNTKDLTVQSVSMAISAGKEIFGENQGFALASVAMSTAVGIAKALELGFPFDIIQASIVGATGAAQMASISKQKFEDGGIVQGNSPSGDRISVGVNSEEMILNKQQQSNLFAIANGNGGGGGTTNITVNAGAGTDIDALAIAVTNAVHRASQLGYMDASNLNLEPQI